MRKLILILFLLISLAGSSQHHMMHVLAGQSVAPPYWEYEGSLTVGSVYDNFYGWSYMMSMGSVSITNPIPVGSNYIVSLYEDRGGALGFGQYTLFLETANSTLNTPVQLPGISQIEIEFNGSTYYLDYTSSPNPMYYNNSNVFQKIPSSGAYSFKINYQ